MMCDRFGVSDRVASCLATALFKDLGIKDDHDVLVVMDKAKVAREKLKCREKVLRKQSNIFNLTAFSFDSRKDDSFTREKIGDKYYPKIVKQPHLIV